MAGHPLGTILREAAAGRFPAPDGAVELHGRPPGPASAVVAFAGHHVIAADVPPDRLRARLPAGDLLAPLSPRFLFELGEWLGVQCDGVDAVLAAPGLDGAAALRETSDRTHPRVARALAHRDDVRAFTSAGVAVTLGRGLAGRLEVAFEVDPEARGRGAARAALLDARRLAGAEPLFAQTAPGNAASHRALLAAGFVPIGGEALFFDRAADPAPAAALVLTGSPGAGKSSVLEALTTLLGDAGIDYGAIESEQLGWGLPWLPDELQWAQLATVCRMQRGYGRRLFLVVATTETDADVRAVVAATGAERTLVVCLYAPPDVVAERVLAREPERWSGRDALARAARRLAGTIPGLAGVDVVLSTDGETDDDVARRVREELAARGLLRA